MTEVYLRRHDPARNMARFYRMQVLPTLFGEWDLVREWGRIGQGGQVKAGAFESLAEASAAMERFARQKVSRGYAIGGSGA